MVTESTSIFCLTALAIISHRYGCGGCFRTAALCRLLCRVDIDAEGVFVQRLGASYYVMETRLRMYHVIFDFLTELRLTGACLTRR